METRFLSSLQSIYQPITEKIQPVKDKVWATAKPSIEKAIPTVQGGAKRIIDYSIRVDTALIGLSLLHYSIEIGRDSVVSMDRKNFTSVLKSIGGLGVATSYLLTAGYINYIAWNSNPSEMFTQK